MDELTEEAHQEAVVLARGEPIHLPIADEVEPHIKTKGSMAILKCEVELEKIIYLIMDKVET